MPQHPTCTNIKIRSVRDAQRILYACYQGHLPMIKARLDSGDRHALASGNVYAWEERESRSEPAGVGIERFTEGKRWTPSRLKEDFLYYHEKYLHLSESDQRLLPPPANWEPFIKQTYSAWVTTQRGDRKWHLTAYYTDATSDTLATIDDIPLLRDIVVPEGHFRTNAEKIRRSDDTASHEIPFTPRTYAAYPPPWSPNCVNPSTSSASGPKFRALSDPDYMDRSYMTTNESFPQNPAPPTASHTAIAIQYQRDRMPAPIPIVHSIRNVYPHQPAGDAFDIMQPSTSFGPRYYEKSDDSFMKESPSDCLVPLQTVLQAPTYHRDPLDDETLRMLGSCA